MPHSVSRGSPEHHPKTPETELLRVDLFTWTKTCWGYLFERLSLFGPRGDDGLSYL